MRTFVSLDTETGIIRRYSETAKATHVAGLTHDPNDAVRTQTLLEGFRVHPGYEFKVPPPGSWEQAMAVQQAKRMMAQS